MIPFVAGAGRANIDLMFSGLERLPCEGEEIYADGFSMHLGGGPLATLINLSRLNIPIRAGSFLGDDIFSRFVFRELEKTPVSLANFYDSSVYNNSGGTIPLNVSVTALTRQDRTFISYTDKKQPSDNELQKIYELCSGACIAEMQTGYLEVYQKLKTEGTLLVFDSAPEDTIPRSVFEKYLELADYWTANRQEALMFTGCNNISDAARTLCNWQKIPIIKLDSSGCLIYNGSERIVPAINEFKHADSTGAGDAFLAGFIYGLYHHKTAEEAVLLGNITGGICVTKRGALTAFFNEEELLGYFEKYRNEIKMDISKNFSF